MIAGEFVLTRSVIHDCPAIKLPQNFVQQLGNTAQIVVLKGATDEIANFIVSACNQKAEAEKAKGGV